MSRIQQLLDCQEALTPEKCVKHPFISLRHNRRMVDLIRGAEPIEVTSVGDFRLLVKHISRHFGLY
jgi:hypothetical protein